jgi:hypothetical protein
MSTLSAVWLYTRESEPSNSVYKQLQVQMTRVQMAYTYDR